MPIIDVTDLPEKIRGHELAPVLVAGANAKALRVAPCLGDNPSAELLAEARLTLIGAVARWSEVGAGAATQMTAGPFSQTVDTRNARGYGLWPSEIAALQELCSTASSGGSAFSIRPAGSGRGGHLPWCSLAFGAAYCSCGTDIAGRPIFEGGDEL